MSRKENVERMIKSCIVSSKGGVPLNEIEGDYRLLVGENIPWGDLGYRSLRDFISSIDCVQVRTNYLGESVLSVSDPKIAHIQDLVSKQKNPSARQKNRNFRSKQYKKNRYATGNKNIPDRRYESTSQPTNPRMEYTKSKWYSNRPNYKDSWAKKNQDRKEHRNDAFNNRRQALQRHSPVRATYDKSWSSDDTTLNLKAERERIGQGQENRNWRMQVRVADQQFENSTVGRYQQGAFEFPRYNNSFFPSYPGGVSANNSNGWWWGWCRSNNQWATPRDTQGGQWWPGLQGPANVQPSYVQPPQFNSACPATDYTPGSPGQDYCLEPIINGSQLIGDDFFLQLAIKNLGALAVRPLVGAGIECGLCVSGQTIDECRQRLEETPFLMGRVTILLGAVDIFRGHSLQKMIRDMKRLLDVCRNRFNLTDITLCTIPPLANYSVRCNLKKLSVFYSFNNWIKLRGNVYPEDSYMYYYNVIDLFSRLTDANHRTLYDYFQIDARMVSGCSYPHVLWNREGRRMVMSLI